MTPEQQIQYEVFFDHVLQGSVSDSLKLLSMELYYDSRKDECLQILGQRKISKLEFRCLWDVDRFELPTISMAHLDTLCLRGFQVVITAPLYYRNINTIEFYEVEFVNETLADLLLGCPILRKLLMENCGVDEEILTVVSNYLTTLIFNEMRSTRMMVEAVNLKHISLTDAEYELENLSNISSVTSATLSLNANLNRLLNFMPKLQHLVVINPKEGALIPECVSSLWKVLIKMGDNDIAFERVTKREQEVESLAKYEESYRQVGDVSSKLTIEETTFRDIEERKMEFYRAIVEMEQDGTDEILQVHTDRIQSSLEELVKSLSECCKKFGLHSKPTTLMELPSDDKSKSPVLSPARSTSPHDGYNLFRQTGTSDVKDSQSEFGLKSSDRPLLGTFDTNDNGNSFWGTSKDMDRRKFSDDLFGQEQWTLPCIRTSSSQVDDLLAREGIYANYVPGTLPDGDFLQNRAILQILYPIHQLMAICLSRESLWITTI